MSTHFSTTMTVLAAISGVSKFLYFVIGLCIVAGVALLWKAPAPFKGFGYGLIAGTLIVSAIIFTGPMK
jgi:hypothetical protein